MLNARRKGWLHTRPLFDPFESVGESEIEQAELRAGEQLPADLKAWLLAVGYGDIDEKLSFRRDWFHKIEDGRLAGSVTFAQDELGNLYAFDPNDGSIFFLSRSSPEYARLASHFRAFMEELERRDFRLEEWTKTLSLMSSEG